MPEQTELEKAKDLVAGAEAAAIKVDWAKEVISNFVGLAVEESEWWEGVLPGVQFNVDLVVKSPKGHPVGRMTLSCYPNGVVDLHFQWAKVTFNWFQELYILFWKEVNPGIPRPCRCG